MGLRASTVLCALLACSGAGCGAQEREARAPDILLISIDSLRADHLGCYGYAPPTSPTIDRLAREGVRCENAISTTSWTLPAHAAMFTGLFDSAHGLVDNGLELAPGQRTLAELMQARGYQTAGFYGGPYLHPTFGLDQGFDHYQSCMTTLPDDTGGDAVRKGLFAATNSAHRDITGPRTLAEFERWLARADERPLFAFVHLWDVHYDYIPPPEYVELFDPDYQGTLNADDLLRNAAVHAQMPPRDRQHLVALYDGEIRATDDVVARLLALLDEHGRARGGSANTLVVVTADHGEEFFEHGGKGHQRSLFDEVVRVPLILHWPGTLTAGRVIADQVRLIDLFPTLATFAGERSALAVQGRDIGPLLRGEPMDPAPALCELLVDRRDQRALRTNASKALTFNQGRTNMGFDLDLDPREQQPLTKDAPQVAMALSELQRVLAATQAFGAQSGARARPAALDQELEERLKRLGYTGDGEADDAPKK